MKTSADNKREREAGGSRLAPASARDEEALSTIRAILDSRRNDVSALRRQSLLFVPERPTPNASPWLLYGRVTVITRTDPVPPPQLLEYGKYVFEDTTLGTDAAKHWFEDLLGRRKLTIAERDVSMISPVNFTISYETSARSWTLARYPHLWFRTKTIPAVSNIDYGPLLVDNLPAFPSVRALAHKFFHTDDSGDHWMGELHVLLPRHGAQFDKVYMNGRRVDARIADTDSTPKKYKARVWARKGAEHYSGDTEVQGGRALFRLPWIPQRAVLFLTEAAGAQLVDQWGNESVDLDSFRKPVTAEQWKRQILQDESQTLEFKAYRDQRTHGSGESLAAEIGTDDLASAMTAFANTNDGTVLIGVADDRSIVGVDHVRKTKIMVTAISHNNCEPPITPRVFTVTFGRPKATIVGIEVKCDGILHQTNRRHIYVRRGASVRRATPAEIERIARAGGTTQPGLAVPAGLGGMYRPYVI